MFRVLCHKRTQALGRIALLAAVYFAFGHLGLSLAVASGSATPVWAPTGISIAALLIFGRRMWPGVALGAFLTNITTGTPLFVTLGITAGNTLESLVAVHLLTRSGFDNSLERIRDVVRFAFLGAIPGTIVSATIGVTSLLAAGMIERTAFGHQWELWWFGDLMGALLVTPILLVWSKRSPEKLTFARRVEAATLVLFSTAFSWLVFFGGYHDFRTVLLPFLMWSAIRFTQRGATGALAIASGMGIVAALGGDAGIALPVTPTEAVQIVQILLAVWAVSVLILAATMSERAAAQRAFQERESQLAEAQMLAHLGSWDWEIATNVITWSDELYRIYGLDPSEFPADYASYLDLIHPEDRDMVSSTVHRSLNTGEPFTFVHRLVTPAGELRWLEGRGDVVVDAAGEPLRMYGTALDITEMRLVETNRRALQERFRALFENAAVGMALADTNGRFIQVNRAMERMLEKDPMEFSDLSTSDVARGEQAGFEDLVAELTSGRRDHFVLEMRWTSGKDRPIDVRVTASLIDAHGDGEPLCLALVVEDVTESRRLETFREDFIAKAAHELRTPLTSLTGFLEILDKRRDEMSSAQIDKAVEVMSRQGRRVSSLVNNLLDLSQLEQASNPIDLVPISLAEFVREALESSPAPTGLTVRVEIDEQLVVMGDRTFLEGVITNLLSNAYKYGAAPIDVRAGFAGADAIIRVTDGGDGVPSDFVPYLFEPFTRGDSSAKGPGSGLGLAITRKLVEALGGDIWYENNEPRGARFLVQLRRAA